VELRLNRGVVHVKATWLKRVLVEHAYMAILMVTADKNLCQMVEHRQDNLRWTLCNVDYIDNSVLKYPVDIITNFTLILMSKNRATNQ